MYRKYKLEKKKLAILLSIRQRRRFLDIIQNIMNKNI
jgi:hypothetical protein